MGGIAGWFEGLASGLQVCALVGGGISGKMGDRPRHCIQIPLLLLVCISMAREDENFAPRFRHPGPRKTSERIVSDKPEHPHASLPCGDAVRMRAFSNANAKASAGNGSSWKEYRLQCRAA